MTTVVYENTFEGWLTAVFEIYEYKLNDVTMETPDCYQASLLGSTHIVAANEEKCTRILNGLKENLSPRAVQLLYYCFLSEQKKIADVMLQYVRYVFSSKKNIELDFGHTTVVEITKVAHKVCHEKNRMEGFIRFQLTKDNLYYAVIEPDFNILPLITRHFKDRFADQSWLIYDIKRKYGVYYDLQNVSHITLAFHDNPANINSEVFDESEDLYQKLWQRYFTSINIPARRNMKLHIQHLPKRYWKYLTEKKIAI